MFDQKKIEAEALKIVEFFKKELATIRTNRAAPSLVENLLIDYYGNKTPLIQLASINAPEPKILVIQPWDKNSIKDIEKAIRESDLGLNPVNEGSILRLVLPPLTEERRRELVKIIGQKMEEARTRIRNLREEEIRSLKNEKNEGKIPEDTFYSHQDELQSLVNKTNDQLKHLTEEKEKEILTI